MQTSGAISLSNIQSEFGGSNPISISEYIRGGSLVPDTVANSAIPTSLSNISFNDFYGSSSAPQGLCLHLKQSRLLFRLSVIVVA